LTLLASSKASGIIQSLLEKITNIVLAKGEHVLEEAVISTDSNVPISKVRHIFNAVEGFRVAERHDDTAFSEGIRQKGDLGSKVGESNGGIDRRGHSEEVEEGGPSSHEEREFNNIGELLDEIGAEGKSEAEVN